MTFGSLLESFPITGEEICVLGHSLLSTTIGNVLSVSVAPSSGFVSGSFLERLRSFCKLCSTFASEWKIRELRTRYLAFFVSHRVSFLDRSAKFYHCQFSRENCFPVLEQQHKLEERKIKICNRQPSQRKTQMVVVLFFTNTIWLEL